MKLLSFKGGVHPNDCKHITASVPIKNMEMCKEYVYPMSQHIGAPCNPTVSVGDEVKRGQVIGSSDAFISAPVHSAVSGKVIAIEPRKVPNGSMVNSVIIENDFLETTELMDKYDFDKIQPNEIVKRVREAGIVGMGGAGFPTHVKLTVSEDVKIDTVVVNGAECEPYLTSDYRVMLEEPEMIVKGLCLAMRAVGAKSGKIAIESNKPEGIKSVSAALDKYEGVEVCRLKTKYPQGSEKHIIYAVTGREVKSGKLPSSEGIVVINIDTAVAIAKACLLGMPSLRRIVTVSGEAVANPGNFSVKIGTPIKELVEQAGGIKGEPVKILSGGPMMGIAMNDLEAPVTKGVSAVLLLSEKEAKIYEPSPCLRCGKCLSACPMRLTPTLIDKAVENRDFDDMKKLGIMDCIECGACTFACPAKRYLTQSCRLGKALLRNEAAKEKAKGASDK